MPGPQPPTLTLTETERQGLQKLIQRHSTPQQIALRARIILLAAAGQNHAQIAQTLNVSIDMARLWRQRWLTLQPITLADLSLAERLEDLPRPGTPPRLTADQICQIERLACEKPEQSERPISQWTGREIADELMKRGLVDTISPRHASRLLKRGASSRT
jgi:transposase